MQFERGHLIGDPHLGKKFDIGVPAHRRGERERGQVAQFIRELDQEGDMIVMVGDLFDTPYVSHTVVKQAIDAVLGAAMKRPNTEFVMMAGNHDMPRKLTAIAAFDVFERACGGRLPNLHILTEPQIINGVAFFPWQWDISAHDQVIGFGQRTGVVAAVGHWDLTSFGGEDLHLAPVADLRHAFGDIPLYSGHYHVPGQYGEVSCTGSLQPYSHAEDPEGLIYVTMSLADVQAADLATLRYKCVRIILEPGEEKPVLDALAVTAIPAARRVVDDAQPVALDKFDWPGIVRNALAPLSEEVRTFIQERLPSNETTPTEQRRSSD